MIFAAIYLRWKIGKTLISAKMCVCIKNNVCVCAIIPNLCSGAVKHSNIALILHTSVPPMNINVED